MVLILLSATEATATFNLSEQDRESIEAARPEFVSDLGTVLIMEHELFNLYDVMKHRCFGFVIDYRRRVETEAELKTALAKAVESAKFYVQAEEIKGVLDCNYGRSYPSPKIIEGYYFGTHVITWDAFPPDMDYKDTILRIKEEFFDTNWRRGELKDHLNANMLMKDMHEHSYSTADHSENARERLELGSGAGAFYVAMDLRTNNPSLRQIKTNPEDVDPDLLIQYAALIALASTHQHIGALEVFSTIPEAEMDLALDWVLLRPHENPFDLTMEIARAKPKSSGDELATRGYLQRQVIYYCRKIAETLAKICSSPWCAKTEDNEYIHASHTGHFWYRKDGSLLDRSDWPVDQCLGYIHARY